MGVRKFFPGRVEMRPSVPWVRGGLGSAGERLDWMILKVLPSRGDPVIA